MSCGANCGQNLIILPINVGLNRQANSKAKEYTNYTNPQKPFKSLKDISTLDFSTPSFNPGPFNPRLFNHELSNPGVFNHEFLNHGVKEFIVEKSGVEKSRVEMSFLERWHFNPRNSIMNFSTPWFKNSWLKSLGLIWGWSLGLKSLGLRCPSTNLLHRTLKIKVPTLTLVSRST